MTVNAEAQGKRRRKKAGRGEKAKPVNVAFLMLKFDEMVGILRQCSESGTFFEICIFFQNLRILFPRFPEISEIDSTDHFR